MLQLLDDDQFVLTADSMAFRYMVSSDDVLAPLLNRKDLTVATAIATFIRGIDEIIDFHVGTVSSASDFRALMRLVPDQKIAPAQFAVRGGRLVVVKQVARGHEEDESNIANSRTALLQSGESLIEELSRSNCDRRLLEHVRKLQIELSAQENVIQLGLTNIGCEAMCKVFETELPDALRGMLQGQTRGVGMYVSQFPEWQQFSEKAASSELDTSDIKNISDTAERIASELQDNPSIADPEVPRTILALRELIGDPSKATKRAAFAMIRTIENLVSKALQYSGEFLEKTTSKTIDGLSETASRIIVIGLMTVALGGAVGLSPIASKIGDTSWMKGAAEIVKNQIKDMTR